MLLFLLYKCVFVSPLFCCEASRLQDVMRGYRPHAAVPQSHQGGQQRGSVPSGDSRVLQDGVGCAGIINLRVLRERNRGTGDNDISTVSENMQRDSLSLLLLSEQGVCHTLYYKR